LPNPLPRLLTLEDAIDVTCGAAGANRVNHAQNQQAKQAKWARRRQIIDEIDAQNGFPPFEWDLKL
jgi:hypothetical protein